jgi:drug/metabolite transporter (DMT)-like permease
MALSLLLIVIAGVNFAFVFPVNKIATEAGLPFFAYVFWYAFGAALVVTGIAAARRALPPLSWTHLRSYAVAASLGFALPFALLAFVAPKLPAGVVALLAVLVPTFTYIFSLILRTQTAHLLSIGGLIMSTAGVLFVVVPTDGLPTGDMVWWFLLALMAPVMFAALNVYAESFQPPAVPPLAYATGILWSSVLMLLPLMLGTGQLYLFPGPDLDGDLALLAAVIINTLMWPLFYTIVQRAGAFLFSLVNIIGVVGGVVLGALLLGESHSIFVWIAACLMIGGFVAIVARAAIFPAKRPKPATD